MKHLRIIAIMAITLLVSSLTLIAQESTAEPETTPAAEVTNVPQFDAQGYIRFGHFMTNRNNIDIYVNEDLLIEDIGYPALAEWLVLPTGTHNVTVTITGQDQNIIHETSIDVGQDRWLNVALIGSAADDNRISTSLIQQAMYTDLPTTAQVTFANALASGQNLNFIRNDVTFVANQPVTTGTNIVQNSIATDANPFTYTIAIDTPLVEGIQINTVDTSSYLVVAVGTADDAQLLIDETPLWQIQLLDGSLPAPATLLEAAQAEPLAAPFLAAMDAADLTHLLTDSENITIFVPADYAMDDVDLARPDLADVLRYHIVEGNFKAADLFFQTPPLMTLDGDSLSISQTEQGFVNGAQIIDVNIVGSNGTLHIINGVLDPSN